MPISLPWRGWTLLVILMLQLLLTAGRCFWCLVFVQQKWAAAFTGICRQPICIIALRTCAPFGVGHFLICIAPSRHGCKPRSMRGDRAVGGLNCAGSMFAGIAGLILGRRQCGIPAFVVRSVLGALFGFPILGTHAEPCSLRIVVRSDSAGICGGIGGIQVHGPRDGSTASARFSCGALRGTTNYSNAIGRYAGLQRRWGRDDFVFFLVNIFAFVVGFISFLRACCFFGFVCAGRLRLHFPS
mmetsp:Transcript_3164/g.8950  ORF Transcript_3164/g.8950 Transcript_3164/m.8950 type:complete len:242 (-) Transcript_3164:1783-2508(-)